MAQFTLTNMHKGWIKLHYFYWYAKYNVLILYYNPAFCIVFSKISPTGRYQRGNRSLAENLSRDGNATEKMVTDADEDEEYDIPEELEDVVGD